MPISPEFTDINLKIATGSGAARDSDSLIALNGLFWTLFEAVQRIVHAENAEDAEEKEDQCFGLLLSPRTLRFLRETS